jgi:hypothetical protein
MSDNVHSLTVEPVAVTESEWLPHQRIFFGAVICNLYKPHYQVQRLTFDQAKSLQKASRYALTLHCLEQWYFMQPPLPGNIPLSHQVAAVTEVIEQMYQQGKDYAKDAGIFISLDDLYYIWRDAACEVDIATHLRDLFRV